MSKIHFGVPAADFIDTQRKKNRYMSSKYDNKVGYTMACTWYVYAHVPYNSTLHKEKVTCGSCKRSPLWTGGISKGSWDSLESQIAKQYPPLQAKEVKGDEVITINNKNYRVANVAGEVVMYPWIERQIIIRIPDVQVMELQVSRGEALPSDPNKAIESLKVRYPSPSAFFAHTEILKNWDNIEIFIENENSEDSTEESN